MRGRRERGEENCMGGGPECPFYYGPADCEGQAGRQAMERRERQERTSDPPSSPKSLPSSTLFSSLARTLGADTKQVCTKRGWHAVPSPNQPHTLASEKSWRRDAVCTVLSRTALFCTANLIQSATVYFGCSCPRLHRRPVSPSAILHPYTALLVVYACCSSLASLPKAFLKPAVPAVWSPS
jgi:hypothetical protein